MAFMVGRSTASLGRTVHSNSEDCGTITKDSMTLCVSGDELYRNRASRNNDFVPYSVFILFYF